MRGHAIYGSRSTVTTLDRLGIVLDRLCREVCTWSR